MVTAKQAGDVGTYLAASATAHGDDPAPAPNLAGRKVLVAENEAIIALDLEAILYGFGCAVPQPATTVAEALDLLQHERPDAALINPVLSGGSAMPLVEALRASGVPFALVSNGVDNRRGKPAMPEAPRLDWPYSSQELRRTLLQLLSR